MKTYIVYGVRTREGVVRTLGEFKAPDPVAALAMFRATSEGGSYNMLECKPKDDPKPKGDAYSALHKLRALQAVSPRAANGGQPIPVVPVFTGGTTAKNAAIAKQFHVSSRKKRGKYVEEIKRGPLSGAVRPSRTNEVRDHLVRNGAMLN